MQREIFTKGSRSSNLSFNFLKPSARSLTDFKSSSLFESSSLSGGGGVETDVVNILVLHSLPHLTLPPNYPVENPIVTQPIKKKHKHTTHNTSQASRMTQ
ncbi:hypothetical protein FIM55_07320, partial [Helicobacter pylori]